MTQKGLKMSCIHPFGHHNRTRIIFGNHGFDPFLSHLWSQIGQVLKALLALRGAKIAGHGFKMGSFHLYVHPQ